jgi:hypothetical protein
MGFQSPYRINETNGTNLYMLLKLLRDGLIAFVLSATASSGLSQVRLTDVVVFGTDANGNWFNQPNVWETRPGGNFNNWIQSGAEGGPFVNGPSDAAVQPNLSLTLGDNSFRLFGKPGAPIGYFGINLFFDGAETPSISAFGPMLVRSTSQHIFAADGAPNTPRPIPSFNTGYLFPGANSLSFVSADQVITLTDFYWASPSVYSLDLTGELSTSPDGANDFVGGITLAITPVPEPHALLWVVGLGAVMTIHYRRRISRNQRQIG